MSDTLGTYGDVGPIGAMRFVGQDSGMPLAVTDPLNHIRTGTPAPGNNLGDWPEASASFDYIDPSVGGQPGTVARNGYTSGLAKYDRAIHHFTGRAVRFVRRDVSKDDGPVGQDNYRGTLAAGVSEQSRDYPSLTEIAQSLIRGR